MRLTFILLLISFANSAQAIKKCKDADGNWHYGDIEVAECENSRITTLNDRGFVTEEQAAPKTKEEIKEEEEEAQLREAEEKQKLAAAEEKRRVLSIYETEEDIDRQRQNQLNSVQSNMDVHNAYVKGMETRIVRYDAKLKQAKAKKEQEKYNKLLKEAHASVKDSTNQIALLERQKTDIIKKFAKEKEIYLALKNSD